MNFKHFFILCFILAGSQVQAMDDISQLIMNPKSDNWLSTLPTDLRHKINLMAHLDQERFEITQIIKCIEINSPELTFLLGSISKNPTSQNFLYNQLIIKISSDPNYIKYFNPEICTKLNTYAPSTFKEFLQSQLEEYKKAQQAAHQDKIAASMPPLRPPANFQYNFQENRLPENQQSAWENCTLI